MSLQQLGAEVCPSGHEWPVLRNKLMERNLEGNLVTDAWIAAVVLHQSESLATFDRGTFASYCQLTHSSFLADKYARPLPRRHAQNPAGKRNMTDERIGRTSLRCEPCHVRLGTMDGPATLVRLGEPAS